MTDHKYELNGAATGGDGEGWYTKTIANTYVHEFTTDPALSDWYKVAQVQTATNAIPRQWGDSYSQGAGASRKSSFTYHPDGLSQTQTIEPDHAALKQITSYGYDSFGKRRKTDNPFLKIPSDSCGNHDSQCSPDAAPRNPGFVCRLSGCP